MKIVLLASLLLVTLLNAGCQKDVDYEKLSSNFVVATNSDPATDFASYNTYFISDSVAIINASATTTDTILKNASTQKLVDAVKQNMNARGYTFVSKSAKPDIGINMMVIKNVDAGVIYSGWWGGYAGWWDPWYWGWYYPYYYPWSYAYVITTGSVIIDLNDVKNVPANSAIEVIWSGVMGGAIGDNLDANVQRGVDGINQAFAQSPTVKRN